MTADSILRPGTDRMPGRDVMDWAVRLACLPCDPPEGAERVAMLRDVGRAVLADPGAGELATWAAVQLLDLADLLGVIERDRAAS